MVLEVTAESGADAIVSFRIQVARPRDFLLRLQEEEDTMRVGLSSGLPARAQASAGGRAATRRRAGRLERAARSRRSRLVEFTLGGAPFQALNGGPMFSPTDAASIVVMTADQAETDRLWDALTADGGEDGRCGWLKDRFGVSWQIVPEAFPRLMASSDPLAGERVWQAVMAMKRLDIAAMEAAAAGGG
jgi:predicted 3-demethylubiquinone-9 3-methyltransferase (glyoxalase superfamily)